MFYENGRSLSREEDFKYKLGKNVYSSLSRI